MRVEVVIAIASAFDVVVQAFICPDRSCTTAAPVRSSVQQPYHGHNENVPVGPLIDLRGGKTVRSKKSAGGSKAKSKTSSKASRSSKTSKSSTSKRHKPSIVATIKAFFASLMNPHFVMKLEAKQKINEVHTVHTVGASQGKRS